MDELYDPEVFEFEPPVWFLAIPKTQQSHLSFDDSGVKILFGRRGNEQTLAIFTDEDLAQRFASSQSVVGAEMVEVTSIAEFFKLLLESMEYGCTSITFDPQKDSKKCRTYQIRELINAIKSKYGYS